MNYQAPDGSWQGIDTRLVSDSNGGTVNKAGPFSVRFAAQADSQGLVRLEDHGASLSFGFDGASKDGSAALATPARSSSVVSGGAEQDTLTYAGVLPSVDLRYQVGSDTLKEALVLNQPLAAGVTPEFSFSLRLDGLRAQTADDGTIEFVNASSGAIAFRIPAGLAMDSSGNADQGIDPAITPVTVRLVPTDDPSVAKLVMSVDKDWLADPARVFPVTIDPTFTNGIYMDAYASSSATTTNYNGAGQYNSGAGQYWDRTGNPGGTNYRSFTFFPSLAWLANYKIDSASWSSYAYSVGGGSDVGVTIKPLNGYWGASSVTWANQPAVRTQDKTMHYSAGSQWRSIDITDWVQNWVDGTWGDYGIRVHSPTSKWANLAAQEAPASVRPYVQVTYTAYPSVSRPSAGGQYNNMSVNTHTPTVSMQIDDSDTPNGLNVSYQILAGLSLVATGTGSSVKTGQRSQWTTPSLADGTYYWIATPNDGTASGTNSVQTFTIDTATPAAPSISTGFSANTWQTATSLSPTFSESPSADGYGFLWGVDVGNNPVDFGYGTSGSLAPGVVPLTSGWHDLAVRTVDQAGNLSGVTHFTFGLNNGGFSTPEPDFTTQSGVVTQATTKPAYDGIKLQWRRSENASWADIPAGNVTYQSSGSGIGSWPVTTTPGTNSSSFPALVWDASSTTSGVDGPLQMRIAFYTSGVFQSYLDDASIRNGTLNQTAVGGGFASGTAGPGSVNLLTGDLTLNATDVQGPAGALSRTFQSLDQNATGSVFGPGWSSNLSVGASPYRSLADNGDYATLTGPNGSTLDFRKQTSGAYLSPDGATNLTLTKISGSRFELAQMSSQTFGFTNYDSGATTTFLPSDVTDATGRTAAMSWTVDIGTGLTRPTQMLAPSPAGVSCTSSPLTTRGCRTLTFDYAASTTATGTSSSDWGDYLGQITTIHYTAWDPDLSTPAMSTVDVASYSYDSNGRLRASWDPRISPALKTTYDYDGDGHISTVTPPGEACWSFGFAPLSGEPSSTGRLGTVSRPKLPSGTATSTFVYQVPLTTAAGGPYNLDATTVASWAQADVPTTATAIYPPDQIPSGSPPSSYTRASVTYMNVQGQAVNTASPGGYITTSEHDHFGNVTRTLSAGNRQRALDYSTSATAQAARSAQLDTQTVYDATEINVIDTYGPAHVVDLPDGSSRSARRHVHNIYDESAPSGGPFNLVTTKTESAAPTDGTAEQDTRTTSYKYAIGTDTSGWTLGTPLQTIIDPGTTPHLNLTTTTLHDPATGNLTARRLPANPTGGDSHDTLFVFYTAGSNTQDSACGYRPEWAELPCKKLVAAQPGTSGLPDVAATQMSKYNYYQEQEETTDTNGSDSRTVAVAYDAAGRQASYSTSSSVGTSTPTITRSYDSATGRMTSTSDGTHTISETYDNLGRLTDYYDADGNHSQYTYDQLDRVSTRNDGKATITYTYDDVGGEHRGLLTTISDPVVGDLTASYDADGQLTTRTYPGSLNASLTYDESGEPVNLAYSKTTGTWPALPATYDIHGERTTSSNALESFAYSYDTAGRLTHTSDVQASSCTERAYALDADTNRTSLATTTTGGAGNVDPCLAAGGATTTNSYTYDAADRSTNTGYAYDAFGRTTAIPASDTSSGFATTVGYFGNDLVASVTTNGITVSHSLDPNQRASAWQSSADGQTHTNHYADDGDVPTWTSENNSGTIWSRNIVGFGGLAATVTNASVATIQLTNLHGDIFSTVSATASDWLSSYSWTGTDEYGNPGTGAPTTGSRYDYLGGYQRERDPNSGLQLMGARLYNSTTGRFLQKDSKIGGSANDYDYVGANPVNANDLGGDITNNVWYGDGIEWPGIQHHAPMLMGTPSCGFEDPITLVHEDCFLHWWTFYYFFTTLLMGSWNWSPLWPNSAAQPGYYLTIEKLMVVQIETWTETQKYWEVLGGIALVSDVNSDIRYGPWVGHLYRWTLIGNRGHGWQFLGSQDTYYWPV